ncbi:MAG: flavin oxidoreductase/NADH oxidase [Clostridiaceae bacterium]|jgi:2,4-dienoyl-CoA reductase-like NADH-dependent reductase (Old Yellow Enzyme family)|nr:flavin oxidoreductase/NADH oxidase [Clostridiaceae bacterium]
MSFQEFYYTTLQQIVDEAEVLGIRINYSENMELFKKPVKVNGITIQNSLAAHPMEGCDGTLDGSPGEFTYKRYANLARGGTGLIWVEATAVVPEGRANPRQLWIHENNLSDFRKLNEIIRKSSHDFSPDFKPVCILQLTHSGRFSKPDGKPAPIIACPNPYFGVGAESSHVISDDELEKLEEIFEEVACLAWRAGFHGVDIKSCHSYLLSELLSGFTRKGKYGETFEGRTRFLMNVVKRIRSRLGSKFIVTTRINIYDGIPYPYGWGTDREDYLKPDLEEPERLIRKLYLNGVELVNISMGTPYYNPHVNRPFNKGGYIPDEHPLVGVARFINGTGEIQRAVPEIAVVGTGYSWLRQFAPYFAAGTLENGLARLIGFGRQAFANPFFAGDILKGLPMAKEKSCLACGKCSDIMRAGGPTGCVVRDAKTYSPVFKKYFAIKNVSNC